MKVLTLVCTVCGDVTYIQKYEYIPAFCHCGAPTRYIGEVEVCEGDSDEVVLDSDSPPRDKR